jgi:predicted enzyme related to lactoylglutathione lyase
MFVLAVPDLARSAAFYRDVLGFEIKEIGDPGWRMYVQDGCRIMAGQCPDAMPVAQLGDHSYFAYLVVDNVDAYHERVASAGAEIIKALASEEWGMREFGLRTVDGHRIVVGQDLRGRDGNAG